MRSIFAFLFLLSLDGSSILRGDASEMLGPDGNYYPDVRGAGVQGGIPTITNVLATITSTQANTDLAGAIQSAVNSATGTVTGLIQLPSGTYTLAKPVFITKNGIVIAGGGTSASSTVINFSVQAPGNNTGTFTQPPMPPGTGTATLYNNTWVEAQVCPTYTSGTTTSYLTSIQLFAGAPTGTLKPIAAPYTQGMDGGNAFCADTTGGLVMAIAPHLSTCVVQCVAIYGTWNAAGTVSTPTNTYTGTQTFNLSDTNDPSATPQPYELAAFNFIGTSDSTSTHTPLTVSGSRGDTTLTLQAGHGINVGDMIQLHCPNTSTFTNETNNACTYDYFRQYQFSVTGSSTNTITLNQPLRIDFPIEVPGTPPYVEKIHPIQNCGVQNLTINQQYNIWTSEVYFYWAWNCWANNVVVNKCGRFPVWFSHAKWCEVNDCSFNGCWYTGGGSSAYAGFEFAFDCLMQNTNTTGLRHGPVLQWSSAGNVVTTSTFTDSDAHWHAGWTNNNLFDNITVCSDMSEPNATSTSYSDFGSLGDGAYSSYPTDKDHGPNGPYNVVYNCDFSSPQHAVYMGGSNQVWTFLWNRFAADTGEGLYFYESDSDNHLFQHNVYALGQTGCGVYFETTLNATNLYPAYNATTGIDVENCNFSATFNKTLLTNPSAQATGLVFPMTPPLDSVSGDTYPSDNLQLFTFPDCGFETVSDTTDWTFSGGAVTAPTSAYAGSYGLHIATSVAGPTAISSGGITVSGTLTPWPIQAGTTYATRFLYRVNSNQKGAAVALVFHSSTGSVVLTKAWPTPETDGAWAPAMVACMAPSNAVSVNVKVYANGGSVANVDFDNFEFGIVSKLGNSSIAFDSGFESGNLTGWVNNGPAGTISVIQERNNAAPNHVLEITQGALLISDQFHVTKGDTYQIRFSASTISGPTGAGGNVVLKFLDPNGNVSQVFPIPNNFQDAQNNPKVAWQQHVVRCVAPDGATGGEIEINSPTTSPATEDLDNFTVLDIPPRPVPVSPSVPSIYQWELSQVGH